MSNCKVFCEMIRNRSKENRSAIARISDFISPAISVLRQELDSMVKVIYLLNQSKIERERLIMLTLQGKKWNFLTKNGEYQPLTDKKLVNLANTLQGWMEYVYRFGCSFIHLSSFHNYPSKDPFESISAKDKTNILNYMRHYHGYPFDNITMNELAPYIPAIFKKISSNLECYLKDLEKDN